LFIHFVHVDKVWHVITLAHRLGAFRYDIADRREIATGNPFVREDIGMSLRNPPTPH
jgi:hypothetical protein